ncbi:MAG: carboxy-S-adenosyl-L-methionine synthase CmoA [Mariprofundaceae bacterium]
MGNASSHDDLFGREDAPSRFRFDAQVARVFDDMIRRSVPGYALALETIGLIAARHAMPGSRLYDLGCSLGAATLALAQGAADRGCMIVGVDNAPAMLERARLALRQNTGGAIRLVCADIRDVEIRDASVVVLNFTLQFLPPRDRLPLLRRIHAGLRPGGVLLLSEKIAFADEGEQARQTAWHEAFKQAQGYSALEVARKRRALERVLMPETIGTHKRRLTRAGFASADVWFRCFNFASLIALRR